MENNNNGKEFPENFVCPLTLQVMTDPVVDPEGNSYERKAIEDWLQKNTTSPVTKNPLTLESLVPNGALRAAIEQRRRELKEKGDTKEIPKASAEQGSVSLSVSATKSWTNGADEALVLVSVKPPIGEAPTPCDICCVVDVSGSMSTEATMKNASGGTEAHGLSLLDIVKHAVKTIANILQPKDRLSLVTYSSNAKTIFELIPMDQKGKQRVQKELDGFQPDGQTNLWDGLHSGLEVLRKAQTSGRLGAVLLLTDGQPNVIPPRGHIPMLQKYKDEHKQLSCSINTFGFGYNLESELLKDLATEGNGMYAFIPDSGFVGTAFVNATSNLLATMAKNTQLPLEPMNGATIVSGGVLGGHPCEYASWGALVNFGSIQYEQVKDVVLRIQLPKDAPLDKPYLCATLKYDTSDKSFETKAEGHSWEFPLEVEAQRHRLASIDAIHQAMALVKSNNKAGAKKLINDLISEIKGSASAKSDKRVQELLKDLEGEVKEAFAATDSYSKWGMHYLPSLCNAHRLQMCNNFKDPGVQIYGGKLFRKLRDQADEIFIKLPPPKPSHTPSAAPVRSMGTYHSSGNPCFHGKCLVQMFDGTHKQVSLISKGDQVITLSGKSAQVKCVVKTNIPQGKTDLVELEGGLLVTPYHPVKINDTWQFPCSIAQPSATLCSAVYSFVLSEGHLMNINEVTCVTLGHNFQGDVVGHTYFGSQKVIEDLKSMEGWDMGLVQLQPGCLVRDNSGLVSGLLQQRLVSEKPAGENQSGNSSISVN